MIYHILETNSNCFHWFEYYVHLKWCNEIYSKTIWVQTDKFNVCNFHRELNTQLYNLPEVLSPGLAVNFATSTILTANVWFDFLWMHRLTIENGPLKKKVNIIKTTKHTNDRSIGLLAFLVVLIFFNFYFFSFFVMIAF